MQPRKPLTASTLRAQIGGKATSGLGACARKSLQDEFDGIVACMKHLMESYEGARSLLGQTREILESNSEDKLNQLKQLLDVGQQESQSDEDSEDNSGGGSLIPLCATSDEMKTQVSTPTTLKSSLRNGKRCSESESSTLTISDHVPSDDFEDFSLFDDSLCLDDANATTTNNNNMNTVNNHHQQQQDDRTPPISSLDSEETKNSENNSSPLVSTTIEASTSEGSSDDETIPLVRAKLIEWETLVKSYQHPSRILRWTSGQLYPE